MPRGFKFIQAIMRGLRSPTVKKIVEWGSEHISPRIGELLLRGTERLRGSGLGDIAEKITDASLRGMASLPGTIEVLQEAIGEEEPRSDKKAKRRARRMKRSQGRTPK